MLCGSIITFILFSAICSATFHASEAPRSIISNLLKVFFRFITLIISIALSTEIISGILPLVTLIRCSDSELEIDEFVLILLIALSSELLQVLKSIQFAVFKPSFNCKSEADLDPPEFCVPFSPS